MVDWQGVRDAFPILKQTVNGQPLLYLDNAATSQKPQPVIDALVHYYSSMNANVHRGAHQLSASATQAYEAVRTQVAKFINAPSAKNIVFVKGATEGINCVAESFVAQQCQAGDEVIISILEHHSNIVPWQRLAERHGIVLKIAPMHQDGTIDVEAFQMLLSPKVKLCSLIHASNVLGTINPMETLIEAAHAVGAKVLVDATQSAPHFALDVQAMHCDFLVMSGHKMFAPTGIGVLYGRSELLESMPPYQSGGAMIQTVASTHATYLAPPYKFEAGTPNVSGVMGLGAAISFIESIGFEAIETRERATLQALTDAIMNTPGWRIYGAPHAPKVSVLSVTLEGAHGQDIAMLLDQQGIAVRSGHHCAMPLMEALGVDAMVRISLSFHNDENDVDRLVEALKKTARMLKGNA